MHMPLNKKKQTKNNSNKNPTTEKPRWGREGINFLTNNHFISNTIEM